MIIGETTMRELTIQELTHVSGGTVECWDPCKEYDKDKCKDHDKDKDKHAKNNRGFGNGGDSRREGPYEQDNPGAKG
jgi:hypothetical protein